MKRTFTRASRFSALLTLLAVVFSLSSCKRNKDATELLFTMLEGEKNIPAYRVYYSCAPEFSEGELTESEAGKLYGDEKMTSYAEDFAVALGKEDSVWEIHIFRALSESDAKFISDALSYRLDMIQKRGIRLYDTENYDEYISCGRIFRKRGRLVCLLICDEPYRVFGKIK